MRGLGLVAGRVPGLLLFAAGLLKLLAPSGGASPTAQKILRAVGDFGAGAYPLLVAVAVAEMLLGVGLVIAGPKSVLWRWLGTSLFTVFALHHVIAVFSGAGLDTCPCLGEALRLSHGGALIVSGACLGLMLWGSLAPSEELKS